MKNRVYLLLLVSFMCICINAMNVLACSKEVSRDLTKEAYYVKTNYEIVDKSTYKDVVVGSDKTTFKIPKYEFNISVYNITENIYFTIQNNVNASTSVIHYSDTENGTYNFVDTDFGKIYKYEIKIYPENQDCSNKLLKTIKFDRPMYNAYSEYTFCKNSSNYYCQKFTKTKLNLKGNDDFLSKIKVNNQKHSEAIETEKKNNDEETNIIDSVINNWEMYLGIFIGTIFISIILVFVIKKRKSKKEWNV